jgi:hypothetical protein
MKQGTQEHAAAISDRIETATEAAGKRAADALTTFGPFASVHEAASVLKEELREIEVEVYRRPGLRSKLSIRNEALDLAAVAIRLAAQMDVDMDSKVERDWAES